MADSVSKLGDIISSKITGSLGNIASGAKGAFISANPAVFAPMTSILGKGFSSLNKDSAKQAKDQKEESQRRRGFEEERASEAKKAADDMFAVTKNMAASIDAIARDVKAILEIMKKPSFLDDIVGWIKGLFAGIGTGLGAALDGVVKFFKDLPGKIGTAVDDVIKFFKDLPGRIGNAIDGLIKFFKDLPSKIGDVFSNISKFLQDIPNNIGNFFNKIFEFFDDFTKNHFPKASAAIAKFFSDIADIFKFDAIKGFFTEGLNKLKAIFNFDDFVQAISSKFNDLVKLLNESDIAKAFRRINNIFAISFAQYADELEDLFNNKLMTAFDSVKASIGTIGTRISTVLDDMITSFRESKIAQLGDDLGTKISGAFGSVIDYFKESKVGLIADDVGKIISGLFSDIKGMIKMPDFGTFFDLGKASSSFDELKYVLGEGGVIEKGIALVGSFVGNVGGFFGKIFNVVTEVGGKVADLLSGPLKFFGELTDLAPMFKALGSLAKILGPIGVIFSVIDGLVAAFDTEALAKTLGKATGDVTWKDRIAGFFGGVIGGVFGLFDLIIDLMGFEKGEESLQSRVTSMMTKGIRNVMAVFGNIIDLIVGIVTFDSSKIGAASANLADIVKNSFATLANVFVDSINWLIGKLPGWLSIDKLSRLDTGSQSTPSAAPAAAAPAAKPVADTANQTSNYGLSDKPVVRMGASDYLPGYNQNDLKRMGLNIKVGDVQKAGAKISPATVDGARYVQSNVKGVTFTGFNDNYHDKHSPTSAHRSGLAFDFVIPNNLASDDAFRASIAKAISKATGGRVIDEYAFPSAKSTGGHFHVDFVGAKGVNLGTGSYLGNIPTPIGPAAGTAGAGKGGEGASSYTGVAPQFDTSPLESIDNSPFRMSEKDTSSYVTESNSTGRMDTDGSGGFLSRSSASQTSFVPRDVHTGLSNTVTPSMADLPRAVEKTTQAIQNLSKITLSSRQIPVPLTEDEKIYFEQEKKRYAEDQEYRTRKKSEETTFFNDLSSIFSDLVKTVQGNVISTKNAGDALSKSLLPEFKSLGVAVFGKQYGEKMGATFQRLSGVYMDQFINQSLAPSLGMNADILNRSINTYVEGAKLAPQIKQAEDQLIAAQKTLEASQSKGKVTQADIVRAAGKGGFTSAQSSMIAEQTRLRAEVENKRIVAEQLKEQRSEYERSAMEDLMYGMTGVASGPKTFVDAYGGADQLVKDLTTLTGSPFKSLFNIGDKGIKDPQLAYEARMKQTQTEHIAKVEDANGKLIAQKVSTDADFIANWVRTGENFNDNLKATIQNTPVRVESGYLTGAAVSTAPIVEQLTDDLSELFGYQSSGTVIPGVASTSKYSGVLGSGISASDKSSGGTIVSPNNDIFGKLKGTATQMAGSFILDKLTGGRSSKSGIVGGAAGNLLTTLLSGGNLTQSLGSSFGMKLGSNASIMDLLSGSSSMGGVGSMFSNMAMSSWTPDFMRQGMMDFGGGINAAGGGWEGISGAMGSGNTSTMLGAGAGMLGNAFSGYGYGQMANSMIAGDKSMGEGFDTFGKIASVAASAVFGPIGGAIVGGIQGLINAAFGQGPKKVGASGIQGNIGVGGSNLSQFADWSKEGGWFSSGSSGTDISAASSETVKAFDDTIKGIVGSFDILKDGIGLTGKSIANFSQSIKLNLKDLSEADQMAAIQKAFTTFGTGLINFALPDMLHFRQGSEDLLQTMQRLADATATATPTIRALGFIDPKTFFALENVTGLSADFMKTYTASLMDKLIIGFGGKEQFQSVTSEFASMAFSPEEMQKIQYETAKADLAAAKAKVKETGITFSETAKVADPAIRRSEAKRIDAEARGKLNRGEITEAQYADVMKANVLYLKTGVMEETMNKSSGTANAPKRIDVLGDTSYMKSLQAGSGEAFAGANLSNVKSPEIILAESVAALGVTTSTSLALVGVKTITASDLINSGLVTAAQLTAAGITQTGIDTISAASLIGTGLVNSTQLLNAGLITAADVSNEGLFTLSDYTINSANTLAVATTTAISTASLAMVSAANALGIGISALGATVGDLSNTISEGGEGGQDAASSSGVGPSGGGGYNEGPDVGMGLGAAIAGAVSGISSGISSAASAVGDFFGGLFGGGADASGATGGGTNTGGDTGGSSSTGTSGGSPADAGDSNSGGFGGGGGDGGAGPQARGGIQSPNRPYIVGEVGPEIVVPNRTGTVIPTHKILEAMNQSNALDSLTRNTLNSVVNNSNPKDLTLHHVMSNGDETNSSNSFLREQHNNRGLNAMRETSATLNSAIIDNSVTTVSSPSTNISTSGTSGDVRGSHPIAGAFARTMTSARGFGV